MNENKENTLMQSISDSLAFNTTRNVEYLCTPLCDVVQSSNPFIIAVFGGDVGATGRNHSMCWGALEIDAPGMENAEDGGEGFSTGTEKVLTMSC